MPYLNHIAGLKREYHHIRTNRDGDEGYEPAMVILHPQKKGKSFIIPLQSVWKYIEPIDNQDAYPSDIKDFQKIVGKAMRNQRMGEFLEGEMKIRIKKQAIDDLQACAFASALWNENKILPTVAWNLFKMMTMFDIEPSPQAAAQLLLFIQDGLDDLKNMPNLPPEKELTAGEITLWEGGKKIVSKDLGITESDLMMEEGEA